MNSVVHVIGARPQFVKYAALARRQQAKEFDNNIRNIVIHSGQHYDYKMSEVFFEELSLKQPDYFLNVGSDSHGVQTARVLERIESIYSNEKPDIVVVYGDTNSTLGGCLAAAKLHIPIVHVEAGLRSFAKSMPEEINRVATDHMSTFLLSPSKQGVENLRREGLIEILNDGELVPVEFSVPNATIDSPAVVNIGDLMYDNLLYCKELSERNSSIQGELDAKPGEYAFMTVHRAENTDMYDALKSVCDFANELSDICPIIFPAHPRTVKMLKQFDLRMSSRIRVIEPLGYFDVLQLLGGSRFLLTDSGGMQKEAYWLNIPCITMRDQTEWVETIADGMNVLFKDFDGVIPNGEVNSCYGDGHAADRILKILVGEG